MLTPTLCRRNEPARVMARTTTTGIAAGLSGMRTAMILLLCLAAPAAISAQSCEAAGG
jgi:hypothetical protein